MSYRHSNIARELEGKFDSAIQRYIMIEAAHLADNRGILRYSHKELAGILLLSRVTVCKEFRRIIDKGLIIASGNGRYKINLVNSVE